jgi:hypothetical protein
MQSAYDDVYVRRLLCVYYIYIVHTPPFDFPHFIRKSFCQA